jgi:hypothetical protein
MHPPYDAAKNMNKAISNRSLELDRQRLAKASNETCVSIEIKEP